MKSDGGGMLKGIDSWLEKYVMRHLELMLESKKVNHDFTHMDMIFKPIGGQDKGDVFAEKR